VGYKIVAGLIKMNSMPHLNHESELWKKNYTVIGIDEVGRGAFAGPLFAAGVIFSPESDIKYLESLGINDSKKLKPNTRKLLSKIIQKECFAYHISKIDVAQINRIGVGKATFCAMRDVVKNLSEKLSSGKKFVLVDGFYVKYIRSIGLKNQKGIVKGDSISLSIAAASIIAKVARDSYMRGLSAKYPEYGWGRNKGYGSFFHREAIVKHGQTKMHRTAFIKNFLPQGVISGI
jgi:ribonuclease HII